MTSTPATDEVARGVDVCLSYIREMHGGVSLVEIKNLLENAGIPTHGDVAVTMPADRNVVWWAGMSQTFADVALKLLDTRAVELQPTTVLTYMVDGEIPNLPIATRLPKGGYTKVHWFPVTYSLRSEAPITKKRKRARA